MGISAIIGALSRLLRGLSGMREGDEWTPLRICIYSFLGLVALALVFAWLTATPLECISATVCEER